MAGKPQHSSGSLTVSTLAAEADLPRHRLYEHHGDLVTEFQSAVGGGPIPPSVAALQQQLAEAHARVQRLEATEAELTQKIKTLRAVIVELTHETYADNVHPMPRTRR